jgi:hypothetical protein
MGERDDYGANGLFQIREMPFGQQGVHGDEEIASFEKKAWI